MNTQPKIGMMLYCLPGGDKNVFSEEKYKGLAESFVQSGFAVETVLYNDSRVDSLRNGLKALDALLVWVNPIEQGQDRTVLDQMLDELQKAGVFVSSMPETILKIGTKKVLFDTRNMDWGSNIELYATFDEFKERFLATLGDGRPRVLKQFRGNGGEGVFKVRAVADDDGNLRVLHAKRGSTEQLKSIEAFFADFRVYFDGGGPMLNQEWNDNLANGMVRSYMTGKRVVGFGYQEVNALFPAAAGPITPGKRFYFTGNCALFSDLRERMETDWIDKLTAETGLSPDKLPVIWDADFFINSMEPNSTGRYTLCEINVSSVSPFPESAIAAIVDEVRKVTNGKDRSGT